MRRLRSTPASIAAFLALLSWIGWCVRSLDRARAERDQARAEASRTAAVALPGAGFAASDEASARASLSRWIGDRAVATGVRVSIAPLASTASGEVRLKLTARASEPALRRFLRAVEAPDLLRPGHWLLAPDGSGDLRLTTAIAANWRNRGNALPATPLPAEETGRAVFAMDTTGDVTPAIGDVPELIGIAGRLPDDAIAILRLSGGATRPFARGATADGWQITAIAADRVTLTKGGRVHVAVLPPTSK